MDRLLVTGGARLRGSVAIGGSVAAALPILAASLLATGRSTFHDLPATGDVEVMRLVLRRLGARLGRRRGSLTVDPSGVTAEHEIPDLLVRRLRAATLVMGPLLARHGQAHVALPGHSPIGPESFEDVRRGLTALGATVTLEGGVIHARVRKLRGGSFTFATVSPTGTACLMMAAVLARGRTTLEGAACDPEIEELARVLNKMGGRVHGAGTSLVTIEGVAELGPIEHAIPPDRIEAGTLMIAAALTRGDLLLAPVVPEHVAIVIEKLRAAGADVAIEPGGVRVRGPARLSSTDVVTRPHPGFPSDLQPAFLVLQARSVGESMMTETVHESRFAHAAELGRLGADIAFEGRCALVRGPAPLGGARIVATDPHAAAALLLAGLVAEGTTEILRVSELDRGYERLDRKLAAVGADVRRTDRPTARTPAP